jgi:hypothetical protein
MMESVKWNPYGEFFVNQDPEDMTLFVPVLTIVNDRPIMRISHARSRYIYDLYYKREAISKPLYDWLLKEGYADAK